MALNLKFTQQGSGGLVKSQPFGGTGIFGATKPTQVIPTNKVSSGISQMMQQPKSPSLGTVPSTGGIARASAATVTPQPSRPVATAPQQTSYSTANTYQPILDYQRSSGGDTSMQGLMALASSRGIQGYTGTDQQNQQLSGLLGSSPMNNPTPQPQQPTPQPQNVPQPVNVTSQALLEKLATQNVTSNPDYQKQLGQYNSAVDNLQRSKMNEAQSVENIYNQAVPLEFTTGQASNLKDKYFSQQQALQGAVNQYQTGLGITQRSQELAQNALGTAAGFAQPVTQFGMLTNPQTGQPLNQNLLGGVIGDVAARVKDGTMTYQDAISALSGYGQAGVSALLQNLGGNFNVAQSNSLAGQQGTIGVNYTLAQNALVNVENLMKDLGVAQGTNVPLINSVGNFLSTQTGLGSEQTRAVTGAVQSLRNAYASLLASVKGGTPTDYSNQAIAEIPNSPTPNDIAAVRTNMETLGKARAEILGNPGAANPNNTSTSPAGFAW